MRTSSEFEIVRTIKEKECFLSANPYKEEAMDSDRRTFKLPDGSSLDVNSHKPCFHDYIIQCPFLRLEQLNSALQKSSSNQI